MPILTAALACCHVYIPVHKSNHTVGTLLHRVIVSLPVLQQHMHVAQYMALTSYNKFKIHTSTFNIKKNINSQN